MKARTIAIGAGILTLGASALLSWDRVPGLLADLHDQFAAETTPLTVTPRKADPGINADPTSPASTALSLAATTALALGGDDKSPALANPALGNPVFDVARISATGASVFAGRSQPNETVTILADGAVVGSTTADGNGNWSLVTDTPISSPDAKLALRSGAPTPTPSAAPVQVASAATASAGAGVSDVNNRMMNRLQGLVEDARKQVNRRQDDLKATPPPPASTAAVAATSPAPSASAATARNATATRMAAASVPTASPTSAGLPAASTASIPIPIQFVFREARFTQSGERAAALLLEYLKLKGYAKVTLSGHADDRGSPSLNMRLSKDRLAAVRAYLRKHGYRGRLVLLAKGEVEPFGGVDRGRYSREELYQLDRRVELRVSN